jgi:hypothetical protein
VAEALALLEAGDAALASGDWVTARSTFAAASEIEETPEAILGFGNARWWLGEIREAMADWERAYAGFVRRPDPPQAVVVAVTLSLLQNANFGNRVVSAGWAARAERLADGLGAPTLTRGSCSRDLRPATTPGRWSYQDRRRVTSPSRPAIAIWSCAR